MLTRCLAPGPPLRVEVVRVVGVVVLAHVQVVAVGPADRPLPESCCQYTRLIEGIL